MSNSNHKVRVLVRTRPTAKFAHDMINLEADGKVSFCAISDVVGFVTVVVIISVIITLCKT